MSRTRAKLSPFTVIGELLLLGGLGVFGFLLWQPWYTANVVAVAQSHVATNISAQWVNAEPRKFEGEIPVPVPNSDTGVFGILYVPAFGDNWANQLVTNRPMNPVMDDSAFGIAHYQDTALPGQKGNVAFAAHRSGGHITPFRDVDFLRVGDPIFIETADGWFTYRFRSAEYVLPDGVGVLNPMPHIPDIYADQDILTFTTCNPKYWGADERMIAYSVFESFTPRADGPPAELAQVNSNVAESAKSHSNATTHFAARGDH
ncbi:class E sortase [Canibacter zhoujuaniae]|uniref:class E sortase n=1 Tax=Canibacter zhoujuaniae TaxID=2708343 RepID=UPI00141FF4B7|nr:class E sortase [Canibacter zhoujuaniae]